MKRAPPITALPLALRLVVLIAGLGVPIYGWATFSGLYRWLAQVQIAWFDGYYAILTGVLSVALFLCPLVLLMLPLARLFEPAPTVEQAKAQRTQAVERGLATEAWLQRNFGWFLLGLLLVGLVGTGIWFQVQALLIGPRTPIDLATLEAGADPPSRWVDLSGRPGWGESLTTRKDRGTWLYAPIRSDVTRKAALLLEIRGKEPPLMRRDFSGLLARRPPGIIIAALAKHADRIAPEPWVLEVDRSPAQVQVVATGMFGTAGLFAVIGGVIALVRRRRRR